MDDFQKSFAERYAVPRKIGDGYRLSATAKGGALRASVSKKCIIPQVQLDAVLEDIKARCTQADNPNALLMAELGPLSKSELVALLIRRTTPEAVVADKQEYIAGALTSRFMEEMAEGNLTVISLHKIRRYLHGASPREIDDSTFEMHPKLKGQTATDGCRNEYIFYRPDHTVFADQLRESLGPDLSGMLSSIPRLITASLRPEPTSNTIRLVGKRLVGNEQQGYKEVPYDIEVTEFLHMDTWQEFDDKLKKGDFNVKLDEKDARQHVTAVAQEVFKKLWQQADKQDNGQKETFILKAMAAFPTDSATHLQTSHLGLIRLMPKDMLTRVLVNDPARLPVLQEELALRQIAQGMASDITEAGKLLKHSLHNDFPQVAWSPSPQDPTVRLMRRKEDKKNNGLLVVTQSYMPREVAQDTPANTYVGMLEEAASEKAKASKGHRRR